VEYGKPAVIAGSDLLRVLSLASDLGVGLPPGHGLRSAYIALRIAEGMALDATAQRDVVHVALLKDAGCTSWSTQIAAMIRGDEITARREMLFFRELGDRRAVIGWATKFVGAGTPLPARAARMADFMVSGRDFMREGFQSSGEVACRIAARLGASPATCEALGPLFEQWDGKGMPRGLRGEAIPVLSRIVFASGYFEAAHAARGRAAALEIARERSGRAFDPAVADAFARLGADERFWAPIEDATAGLFVERCLAGEGVGDIDVFAECCADFVDMKAYWLAGHSRRVAELAERLARQLRLPDRVVADVRRAGLVHDLGLVAVPSFVLNKPADEQDPEERRAVATHGDILVRLFAGTEALQPIAEIAAQHHGAVDATALAAGAVAVASAFDELTHDGPGALAMAPAAALLALRERAGSAPFAAAAVALEEALHDGQRLQGKQRWPAGLTEREVEVLGLLARGLPRKAIAAELVVSESTVRSHLEHIYAKVDVSTRVGAVLFAIEHGLLA
jgi:HD-GYP domain-containing protein (c-di-GMP phosphodiesterase class II)